MVTSFEVAAVPAQLIQFVVHIFSLFGQRLPARAEPENTIYSSCNGTWIVTVFRKAYPILCGYLATIAVIHILILLQVHGCNVECDEIILGPGALFGIGDYDSFRNGSEYFLDFFAVPVGGYLYECAR